MLVGCVLSCYGSLAQRPTDAEVQAARRPTAAVAILQRSLDKLGGSQTWSQLKGLRATGTVTDGDKTGNFLWEDHWDGHYKVLRVTQGGQRDVHFLQNPDRSHSHAQQTSLPQGPLKKRPEFDPLSTLVVYAPGAAIELALTDTSYALAITPSKGREIQNCDCVALTRVNPNAAGPTNVTVCINHDGQPQRASVELANIKSPDQKVFETIDYFGFVNVQGGVVPSSLGLRSPTGHSRHYEFQSFQMNPKLDRTAFQEDGQ